MPQITFSPEGVEQFKSALKKQAEAWPHELPKYTSHSGSEKAYDEMGLELLRRVRETPGVTPEFINSTAVTGGVVVMPRFMYAGAAKAAMQGYTLDQLHSAMYNHESFNTIARMTRERKSVAKRIEIPLGIKPLTGISVHSGIHHFQIDEAHGLTIPRYNELLIDARLDAMSQGHIEPSEAAVENPSFCVGQTTGINRHVYRHMLFICMNDPNLYPSTIRRSE